MRLVVDASVAAKWFNAEDLSDKAAKVKDAHVRGDVELIASTHIIYEVANSIWKQQDQWRRQSLPANHQEDRLT